MIYSYFKDRIEGLLLKSNLTYCAALAVTVVLWVGTTLHHLDSKEPIIVIVSRLAFTFAYVLITMKIQFNNKVLAWLGKYSFGIYIIQRIPMLIMQKYWLPEMNNYVFVIVSFVLPSILAYFFSILDRPVSNMLFRKEAPVEVKTEN